MIHRSFIKVTVVNKNTPMPNQGFLTGRPGEISIFDTEQGAYESVGYTGTIADAVHWMSFNPEVITFKAETEEEIFTELDNKLRGVDNAFHSCKFRAEAGWVEVVSFPTAVDPFEKTSRLKITSLSYADTVSALLHDGGC